MSAQAELRAVLMAAVEGHAALRDAINGVWFETPVRASVPYALVGEPVGSGWGTKDLRGREARVSVTIVEDATRGERLAELAGEVEAAIEGLAREFGGWRVASLALVKSETPPAKGGERRAVVTYRVRVLEM